MQRCTDKHTSSKKSSMASVQKLVAIRTVILWSTEIVKSEFWFMKGNVRLAWFSVTTNTTITKTDRSRNLFPDQVKSQPPW